MTHPVSVCELGVGRSSVASQTGACVTVGVVLVRRLGVSVWGWRGRRSSARARTRMVPWENNTVTVSVNSSPTASPPKCLTTPSPSKRALTRKDISTKIDAATERRKSYSMQKRYGFCSRNKPATVRRG